MIIFIYHKHTGAYLCNLWRLTDTTALKISFTFTVLKRVQINGSNVLYLIFIVLAKLKFGLLPSQTFFKMQSNKNVVRMLSNITSFHIHIWSHIYLQIDMLLCAYELFKSPTFCFHIIYMCIDISLYI